MSSCAIRESSRSSIAAGRATVRLAGFIAQSIVDGPGLRMTVFAQGCPHACVGCHNQHTHDFSGGQEHAVEDLLRRFDKNPLLSGITLSGGEPLARAGELAPLAEGVRLRGKTSGAILATRSRKRWRWPTVTTAWLNCSAPLMCLWTAGLIWKSERWTRRFAAAPTSGLSMRTGRFAQGGLCLPNCGGAIAVHDYLFAVEFVAEAT